MIRDLRKEEGRALVVIIWIFAIIIVLAGVGVGLTAMGAIRYPPNAVNWPVAGPMLVRLNAQFYTYDENYDEFEEDMTEQSFAQQIAGLADDDAAKLIRDLSFKTNKIDDLEGQLETKNDQMAKLEERIQTLRTQLDDYKPENRKALIKIYDRMETDAALEILSNLSPERAVVILSSMKDSKAAEILSRMDADIALRVTELMAGFSATELLGHREIAGPRTTIAPPPRRQASPVTPPPAQEEFVGPTPQESEELETEDENEEDSEESEESVKEVVIPD